MSCSCDCIEYLFLILKLTTYTFFVCHTLWAGIGYHGTMTLDFYCTDDLINFGLPWRTDRHPQLTSSGIKRVGPNTAVEWPILINQFTNWYMWNPLPSAFNTQHAQISILHFLFIEIFYWEMYIDFEYSLFNLNIN